MGESDSNRLGWKVRLGSKKHGSVLCVYIFHIIDL